MTENKEKITFIATGGTIDSIPTGDKVDSASNARTGRKVIKDTSGIPNYIEKMIAPHFDFEMKRVLMIDSLDINEDHRQTILKSIKETEGQKIIVTHGTDTMIETALFLEKNLKDNDKTIILVGSVFPLYEIHGSDAPFNLGYAIAQAQAKNSGIYLCMNASCFTPDKVLKNRKIGRFEFKEAS